MSCHPPPALLPPRPRWHWLLLFAPAVEALTVLLLADPLSRVLYPRESYGSIKVVANNLFLAVALCLLVGFWWEWHRPTGWQRLLSGISASLLILLLNSTICSAGCGICVALQHH